MTIHQRRTHPEYVEGCFGCKVSTVSFGTVPGGARDQRTKVSHARNVEKGLNRYRELKEAGEQPSGTSLRAQRKDSYKKALWEKHGNQIADYNPPEQVKRIKKGLINKAE